MTPRRFALGVVSAGLLVLAGCQEDSAGDRDDAGSTCDLMPRDVLTQITGTKELFVTGGYLEATERTHLSCNVFTTGSTDEIVRILAYDIGGEEALSNADEGRRGQQEADSCESITTLPGDNGYLCERSDRVQVDASVALDDRLVRFTFYEDSDLEQVTPENVQAWAEEVDRTIRQLD